MGHNRPVAEMRGSGIPEVDQKASIENLADLMQEFRLTEARLQTGEFTVAFRRRSRPTAPVQQVGEQNVADNLDEGLYEAAPVETAVAAPKGTPVTSPMPGIFYAAPSPGAPSFTNEGDVISAGQIIGLIEAMKVFNEIPAAFGGTVVQVVATSGQVVNTGDVLLYVATDRS